MKFTAILGNATRTVGKLFFALMLLLLAVAAGFGVTALVVYRHLDSGASPAARNLSERKAVAPARDKGPGAAQDDSKLRQVAALPSDKPSYTYADNSGGQPSAPVRRERTAASIPAPLEYSAPAADVSSSGAGSNDSESRYIVDSRTGRVIGIDGTAGALREEDEERRRLESAPRAVAVQTPMPEVRVASAVTEPGLDAPTNAAGSQYLPVRRALPVVAEAAGSEPGNFNVAEYIAGGQSRPVLRALPVNAGDSRASRTTRVYRLSGGSQVVAAE